MAAGRPTSPEGSRQTLPPSRPGPGAWGQAWVFGSPRDSTCVARERSGTGSMCRRDREQEGLAASSWGPPACAEQKGCRVLGQVGRAGPLLSLVSSSLALGAICCCGIKPALRKLDPFMPLPRRRHSLGKPQPGPAVLGDKAGGFVLAMLGRVGQGAMREATLFFFF